MRLTRLFLVRLTLTVCLMGGFLAADSLAAGVGSPPEAGSGTESFQAPVNAQAGAAAAMRRDYKRLIEQSLREDFLTEDSSAWAAKNTLTTVELQQSALQEEPEQRV